MPLVFISARNNPLTSAFSTTDVSDVKTVRKPTLSNFISAIQTNPVNARFRYFIKQSEPIISNIISQLKGGEVFRKIRLIPGSLVSKFTTAIQGPIFVTQSEVRIEGVLKLRNVDNYNSLESLDNFADASIFKGDYVPILCSLKGLDLANIDPTFEVYRRSDKTLLFTKELGSGISIGSITLDPNTDIESVELQINLVPADTSGLDVTLGPVDLAYVLKVDNNGKINTIEVGAFSVKSAI